MGIFDALRNLGRSPASAPEEPENELTHAEETELLRSGHARLADTLPEGEKPPPPRRVDPRTMRSQEFEERILELAETIDPPTIFDHLDRLYGPPYWVYGPDVTAHWRTSDGAVEVRCPYVDDKWTPWVKPYSQAALNTWKDRVWFDSKYGEIGSSMFLWCFSPRNGQNLLGEKVDISLPAHSWNDLRMVFDQIAKYIVSDLILLPTRWGLSTIVVSAEHGEDAARLWFNADVMQINLPDGARDEMIMDPTNEDALTCIATWLEWLENTRTSFGSYDLLVDVELNNFMLAGFEPRQK